MYSIDLSAELTESFFRDIQCLETQPVAQKRLTEIAVELFQNIKKHSVSLNHASLCVKKEGSRYCITSTNEITLHEAGVLQHTIKGINALGYWQIKNQHKKILAEGCLSKKQGAGLGLYRIAMRSGSQLIASFRPVTHHTVAFSLHVNLAAKT